jgi:hypothetical protein
MTDSADIPTRATVPLLVLSTGTACSLRCRDCSNFGPYLEAVRYDTGAVITGLRRFAGAVERIGELQIQGGEPFLHDGLAAIVLAARALPVVERVVVATNGMQAMRPDVVEACRTPAVSVRIARYALERSAARVEALVAQLQQEGIAHVVDAFADGDAAWVRLGDLDRAPDADDAVVARRFADCPLGRCPTLENGVLAHCSRATVAAFGGQVAYDDDSYVSLDRYGDDHPVALAAAVRRYLARQTFMEACRRCTGGQGERVTPAVQLEPGDVRRRWLVPVDLDDRGCCRGD